MDVSLTGLDGIWGEEVYATPVSPMDLSVVSGDSSLANEILQEIRRK